jgi:hypothetical protein
MVPAIFGVVAACDMDDGSSTAIFHVSSMRCIQCCTNTKSSNTYTTIHIIVLSKGGNNNGIQLQE